VDLDLPLNNAVLQDLLTDIMHHKDSWPFLRPVPRAQVINFNLHCCENLKFHEGNVCVCACVVGQHCTEYADHVFPEEGYSLVPNQTAG
jgi:hypothetical protein